MNANTHILDAVKVAEELDDLAAKRGNAEALRLLGTLWHRLDSTAPIALHLPNWAKGFTPLELRALLMDEYDRRGELFSLPRRPEVFIVYRIGCNRNKRPTASAGTVSNDTLRLPPPVSARHSLPPLT